MDKDKVKKFLCCAIAAITMIAPLCSAQVFYAEEYDDYSYEDDFYGDVLESDEAEDDAGEDSESDTDEAEEEALEESSVSSVAELDKLAYNGDDLGAAYTKEATTFKVWSPTASRVQVLI